MTTIAITGPTGMFGQALVERMERDPRVEAIAGIARRTFDPSAAPR